VEFRHPDDAELAAIAEAFPKAAQAIADELRLSLTLTELFRFAAQPFDPDCISLVAEAAKRRGFSARKIVSGAGHDAVYVARKVPTAMIFIPCKDGLSHNEEESILPEHAAAGAQVLCDAVLARANRRLA
jgi:N-carbamoyl-L-amino-acid hydrolase